MPDFNSVQTGLLAILLSICGFMLMTSLFSHESSISINNGSDKFIGCCMGARCTQEPIKVDKFGNISYENRIFEKNILVAHLKKHHTLEPLTELPILASPEVKTNEVVKLSDLLKTYFPELQISWSVDNKT